VIDNRGDELPMFFFDDNSSMPIRVIGFGGVLPATRRRSMNS
jgi:hypothetical protein